MMNIKYLLSCLKDKSPEVPFHRITLLYSYFEEFEFLRQFFKKQNMIKKKYQLNRNKKIVDKAQQCFAFLHIKLNCRKNSKQLYDEVVLRNGTFGDLSLNYCLIELKRTHTYLQSFCQSTSNTQTHPLQLFYVHSKKQ